MNIWQKFKSWLFLKSVSATSKPVALPSVLFSRVSNRLNGHSSQRLEVFLRELILWARTAPEEIFLPNNAKDIYGSVIGRLGPWKSLKHRKAAMCEVLRVLAGFESSWDWNCGRDATNPTSVTPDTIEAGIFQVSANSMNFGYELRSLVINRAGSDDGETFQAAMKSDRQLAIEYAARLLRRTCRHNGPVARHEIDEWLSRDAVAAFEKLL